MVWKGEKKICVQQFSATHSGSSVLLMPEESGRADRKAQSRQSK